MKQNLADHPLFGSLPENLLKTLLPRLITKQLNPGTTLFLQGDPFSLFYYMAKGTLKLYRLSEEGLEKIIELVTEGETFAEAIMFSGQKRYPVSSQALTTVNNRETPYLFP